MSISTTPNATTKTIIINPTKHNAEVLAYLKSRFIISESSPSGLAMRSTGKPTGYTSRHWRVFVGLKGMRSMAANTVAYMLANDTVIPEGYTVSPIDGNLMNTSPDNLECINEFDAMFNRKAKSMNKDPKYIGVGYVKRKGLYVGRCKVKGVSYGTAGYTNMDDCRDALNALRVSLGLAVR